MTERSGSSFVPGIPGSSPGELGMPIALAVPGFGISRLRVPRLLEAIFQPYRDSSFLIRQKIAGRELAGSRGRDSKPGILQGRLNSLFTLHIGCQNTSTF